MPVQVVLRDFPEVLAVLRRLRVDPGCRGGDALKEAVGDEGLAVVEEAVAWRRRAARGPLVGGDPTERAT